MTKNNGLWIFGLLILVVWLVSPGPAEASWNNEEKTCRRTIAKSLGRYIATAQKVSVKCHKLRDKKRLDPVIDCNDIWLADSPAAAGRNKLAKKEAGFRDRVGGNKDRCLDTATGGPLTNVLANYPRCPSPSETVDDGATSDGIDNFVELSDCLIALAEAQVEQNLNEILGNTWPAELNGKLIKCHGVMGKAFTRLIDTVALEQAGAQAAQDKGGGSAAWDQGDYDGSLKIQKAQAKLGMLIDKRCIGFDKQKTDLLSSCGDDVTQLRTCVGNVAMRSASGLVAMAFELPGICPGSARVFANASRGEQLTTSRVDVGWTGMGHNLDIADGFWGMVDLACNQDCDNCGVTMNPMRELPQGFCRCVDDPTIHCSTIAGADAACGGGDCRCTFAPPLALSSGGSPVCLVNEFVSELEGTANAGTGSTSTTLSLSTRVFLGMTLTQPCPTCESDGLPNDGLRGGTCNGGSRNGLACDENSAHGTFGPVSYECPPDTANISGAGLHLTLTLTDGYVELPFGTDCDPPYEGSACACAVCSGDTSLPCNSDEECAAVDAGTCSSNGGGAARWPNSCVNGICELGEGKDESLYAETGECLNGPIDTFCDGVTHPNGEGYIPCTSDAECAVMADECGGDCGTCSLAKLRSCFIDPIDGQGHANQHGADLVSVFCAPPTVSSAVNEAGGTPGPGRIRINFDFEGLCPNGAPWNPPGGSSCL